MPASPSDTLGERVVQQCLNAGFALAGVTDALPPAHAAQFMQWLADGKHGSMDYLSNHAALRADPALFLPGVRSMVIVADQYAARSAGEPSPPLDADPASPQGRIARYAQGRDYHDVIKRRLHALCDAWRAQFPGEEFRAFVDTAPVMEREFAAAAGIGWVGKNTLVIHPRLGSWLLLGGIASTLHIPPPPAQRPMDDHCGTCTRCIDACPTAAITPYAVDARRCLSYLTIEHRGEVDPALAPHVHDWLFGCDICQDVCPHNSPRPEGTDVGAANAHYAPARVSLPLLEVLGWSPSDRSRVLSGSSMKRATLAMLKRNAILVLTQTHAPADRSALQQRLLAIAQDPAEDDMVRQQARRSADSLSHAL